VEALVDDDEVAQLLEGVLVVDGQPAADLTRWSFFELIHAPSVNEQNSRRISAIERSA